MLSGIYESCIILTRNSGNRNTHIYIDFKSLDCIGLLRLLAVPLSLFFKFRLKTRRRPKRRPHGQPTPSPSPQRPTRRRPGRAYQRRAFQTHYRPLRVDPRRPRAPDDGIEDAENGGVPGAQRRGRYTTRARTRMDPMVRIWTNQICFSYLFFRRVSGKRRYNSVLQEGGRYLMLYLKECACYGRIITIIP